MVRHRTVNSAIGGSNPPLTGHSVMAITKIQQAILQELCKSEDPDLQRELLAGRIPMWIDLGLRLLWLGDFSRELKSVLYPKQYGHYFKWASSAPDKEFNWYFLGDQSQYEYTPLNVEVLLAADKHLPSIQLIKSLLSEGFRIC